MWKPAYNQLVGVSIVTTWLSAGCKTQPPQWREEEKGDREGEEGDRMERVWREIGRGGG